MLRKITRHVRARHREWKLICHWSKRVPLDVRAPGESPCYTTAAEYQRSGRQKRRCPTETRTNTAAMAAAADTGKPKTSPKSIKFLFGGLAGYVCTQRRALLHGLELNERLMGDYWWVLSSVIRCSSYWSGSAYGFCVLCISFLGSFCEFCCECSCRPGKSLVTPCQSELQFKCHASSCVTEECML